MAERKYGWKPSSLDHRDWYYLPGITAVELPEQVDLRPENPPIYDQLNLGSCTANAIARHLDFNRHKQGEEFITPSRLFIYFNERAHDGDTSTDGGSTIRESVQAVKTLGACPESEWPYIVTKFAKKPPKSCYTVATKYEDLTYMRIRQNVTDMQACLAEGYPFVTGITVCQSFETDEVKETGIVPLPSQDEQVLGGHAICIVGYTSINGEPYWIFANSWGDSFGQSGYGFLPESYLMNPGLASDQWTLRKTT